MIGSNPKIEEISEYIRRNDYFDIYYIVVLFTTLDRDIAKELCIDYNEYIKILKNMVLKK